MAEALQFYASKSSGTADGEAGFDGLGGFRSASKLVFLRARILATLTGVAISDLPGAILGGVCQLKYTAAGQTLEFKKPGGAAFGAAVAVGAGGTFKLLADVGDVFIYVTVTQANLPAGNVTENLNVDAIRNVLFDDLSVEDVSNSRATYRAFFLKNEGAGTLTNIRAEFRFNGVVAPTSELAEEYEFSGSVIVEVEDASSFPLNYWIRNRTTGEMMNYYAKKGNKLYVAANGRRLRSTQRGAGSVGDVIELVAPIDIAFETPTADAISRIVTDEYAPADIEFFYPSPTLEQQGNTVFDLAPNGLMGVWLKRHISRDSDESRNLKAQLAFLFTE